MNIFIVYSRRYPTQKERYMKEWAWDNDFLKFKVKENAIESESR